MSLRTLYDEASLWMTPSGYEDGKLFSELPTDGSGDFTFSRGSNLAATRVGPTGLIEKGRENLILQSNQFDTTWIPQGTLVGGQSDKDGGSSAWSFTSSSTTSGLYQNITTGGVQTFSAYVKKNATNGVRVYMFGSLNAATYFDLNNGSVVSSTGGTLDASIEAYNSEWWRVSVTCNSTLSQIYFYCTNNSQNQAVGTITIQNAQLEAGLVATDYIETGASTAQAGILEDMPRLDYSGGASCPALLLEPQRSNLISHSEYRDGSVVTNGFISQATINSPEGVKNAYKLFDNSAGGANQVNQGIVVSLPSSGTYTYSVFVKADQLNWVRLRTLGFDAGGNNESWFDLLNGTKGTINHDNATIEDYGSGWYRCSVTFTSTSDLAGVVYVYLADNDNDTSVLLDGTSSIFMYGFQVESGSYPTSYIPTYGSSVTRSADRCYLQSADVHSDNSGTMFFEVGDYDTATAPDGFRKIITANAVSASNIDNIIYFEEYAGNNTVLIRKNGSSILQTTPVYQDLRNSKIAIKWSDEGAKVFINGVLNNTYTGDASLNLQYFGHATSYSGDVLSTIAMKQRVHFPTALTDSECIKLTTI